MPPFDLPAPHELPRLLDAAGRDLLDAGRPPAEVSVIKAHAERAVTALRDDTVSFVSLPVLNSRTGDELFAEMLLRLFDPQGMPLPVFDSFLAVQDLRLYPRVMPHLLGRQLGLVHTHERHTSINIPPAMLRDEEQRDILATVLRRYETAGGDPSYVILEITETEYLPATGQLVKFMNTYKGQGYRWALDDFGDGHHTLEHVRVLPLDFVKLSQSLVQRYLVPDNTLSNDLLTLCADRRLTLIAEHTPSLAAAEQLFRDYGIIYVNMTAPTPLGQR
jgi:EAL domain-containing protein (putative c-di-GMP-specific phosphodiesterase class I)